MPTDKKLSKLIINRLTQEQYDAIETPNEDELYLTPDESAGGDEATLSGDNAFTGTNSFAKDVTMGGIAKVTLPVKQNGVTALTMDAWVIRGVNSTDWTKPTFFAMSALGQGKATGNTPIFAPILKADGTPCETLDEVKASGYIDYTAIANGDYSVLTSGKIVKIDDTLAFGYLPVKIPSNFTGSSTLEIPCVIYAPNTSGTITIEEDSINANFSTCIAILYGNLINSDTGTIVNKYYTLVPLVNKNGNKANSIDEVLDGGGISYLDMIQTNNPITYDSESGTLTNGIITIGSRSIGTLNLEQVNIGSWSHIDASVGIDDNGTITEFKRYLNTLSTASQARYQHTLVLTLTATGETTPSSKIVIQAMSSKNTPIDSYQDLNAVFGGCLLKWSGCLTNTQGTSYGGTLDLHGNTIATDKVYGFISGATTQGITLSSFATIGYKDDVCIPK